MDANALKKSAAEAALAYVEDDMVVGVGTGSTVNHFIEALAAQRLGAKAVIVMPVTTPRIKVAAVASRGAKVELHGDSYHDRDDARVDRYRACSRVT